MITKEKKKLPSIYGPRHIKLLPKKNGISTLNKYNIKVDLSIKIQQSLKSMSTRLNIPINYKMD